MGLARLRWAGGKCSYRPDPGMDLFSSLGDKETGLLATAATLAFWKGGENPHCSRRESVGCSHHTEASLRSVVRTDMASQTALQWDETTRKGRESGYGQRPGPEHHRTRMGLVGWCTAQTCKCV